MPVEMDGEIPRRLAYDTVSIDERIVQPQYCSLYVGLD